MVSVMNYIFIYSFIQDKSIEQTTDSNNNAE